MARSKEKDMSGRHRTLENVGIAGAQTEVVSRGGAAVKEHLTSYSGIDQETGTTLKRSLKGISKSKITNPKTDIKSQAGFSAEVKTVARENAERRINGESTRITRTDDMARQHTQSGNAIGGTNDQLYDLAEIHADGSYIEGTGRQLKYVGRDGKSCCERLLNKKFDKYRNADVPIEVPKDIYQDTLTELNQRADSLQRQITKAESGGNTELAAKHKAQLEQVQKTRQNLKQGKLTTKEAIEARLRPKLSTAKDVAKVSNQAGLEAAAVGATVGGGMSFIRNAVEVIQGTQKPKDAAIAITKDTGTAAVLGYSTGFLGATIKGGMENASSIYVRALSKTGAPAMAAVSVLETGKTLLSFASGEIDGLQCLNQLGEKGAGIVASSGGAVVGQLLIPIPVVGAMVGSMVG